MQRLLSTSVETADLGEEIPPSTEVLDGDPRARVATLHSASFAEIGLWEMSAGVARDTETDEVFLVIAGRGQVSFEDGTLIELQPGVMVRLHAGERTVWSVTETLRKVYIAAP